MKFSKNWLQDYIVGALPDNSIIEDALNKKAFEVEGIENIKTKDELGKEFSDSIFDIKVLPNRHGDALSHYYMAKEIAAILNLKSKLYKKEKEEIMSTDTEKDLDNLSKEETVSIKIENENACSIFEIVKIEGVDNRASPELLKNRMESIGQKSINAIVDITNYVQYTMNKPLHAYDEDNVKGGFIIRMARAGEKLLTLDNKELDLDTETLIIADSEKPLGLAGIKGGMYSGVNENTKVILLESANFDPVLIRKTSKKYNIRTDASKRFEAGQSDVLVHDGIEMAAALYREIFGDNIKVSSAYRAEGNIQNSYNEYLKDTERKNLEIKKLNKIELSRSNINEALGFNYSNEEIKKAIEAYSFEYYLEVNNEKYLDDVEKEKNNIKYIINIPAERIDLKIKEDMIEEIGRMLGYDTLIPVLPVINKKGQYSDSMYTEMQIRKYMSDIGYDEIMNYTLRDGGDIYLESNGAPIALRTNISDGLIESFHRNLSNAPLMHLNIIRAYEIGSVFSSNVQSGNMSKENKNENRGFSEYRSLSIICDDNKKKTNYKNELDFLIKGLATNLGVEEIKYEFKSDKPAVIEVNLNGMIPPPPTPPTRGVETLKTIELGIDHNKEFKYKHLSTYPIITRDVSVYYNELQSMESLLGIINDIAFNLLNKETLAQTVYVVDSFDRAMDDGTVKRSAAFRIVYQAMDRTLTDEEINVEVDKIYQALKDVGCELR